MRQTSSRPAFRFVTLFLSLVLTSFFSITTAQATFWGPQETPLPTVSSVELERYLGKWHEIMRIPNEFQDNILQGEFKACAQTTAEYSTLPHQKIAVKNTCHRFNGKGQEKVEVAEAIAYAEKNSGNAKLKVNFTGSAILRALGIGNGRYWILSLGPVNAQGLYSWVLVGEPKRRYGWILSRNKQMEEHDVEELLQTAVDLGYKREQFRSF